MGSEDAFDLGLEGVLLGVEEEVFLKGESPLRGSLSGICKDGHFGVRG